MFSGSCTEEMLPEAESGEEPWHAERQIQNGGDARE